MSYRINVNEERLDDILTPLSAVCGYKIRFFQDETQRWLGQPAENLPFCRLLEKSPKSNHLCTQCNEEANQRCKRQKQGQHYYCHAQLLEFVHPVWFEGTYMGNVNIGQFRSRRKPATDAQLKEWQTLTGVSIQEIKKAYALQPLISDKGMAGVSLLLELCAGRICEAGVFSIEYRDTVNKVEQYVQDHLGSELTLTEIAAHIYVNPSYLSAMYRKATGVPLFEYIQKERVHRASYLMRNSTKPVAEVAKLAGFKDPNYFSKVFRKEMGLSPREYRKKLSSGEIIPW